MLRFDTPEVHDAFKRLSESHFIEPGERAAFGVLQRQHLNGGVDIPAAAAKLELSPAFSGDNAKGFLRELAEEVATAAYTTEHVDALIAQREARDFSEILQAAAQRAADGVPAKENRGLVEADLWEFDKASFSEPRFKGIEAAEFANASYELNYLIDGCLVESQPAFMGGVKKSIKTGIATAMALSLRTGEPFLRKFHVNTRRRVVFLSGESGLATLQETALRICASMGVELSEIDGLTICTTLPRLENPDDLLECEKFLSDAGAEVCIFDPLYLMLSGDDAGNLFKQGALLRNAAEMALSIGATPLFVHHAKSTRLNQFAPMELDDLAWSGCAEFARQWLLISRRKAYEPGSGAHSLWLNIGGSAGHNSLWAADLDEGRRDDPGGRRWDLTVLRAEEARDEAKTRSAEAREARAAEQLEDDRAAACRVLAKHPAGLSKSRIGELAGISNRRWPRVLAVLVDDGDFIPCDVLVSNHKEPIEGYKLNVTESA
jgi:hypothetical protein